MPVLYALKYMKALLCTFLCLLFYESSKIKYPSNSKTAKNPRTLAYS